MAIVDQLVNNTYCIFSICNIFIFQVYTMKTLTPEQKKEIVQKILLLKTKSVQSKKVLQQIQKLQQQL